MAGSVWSGQSPDVDESRSPRGIGRMEPDAPGRRRRVPAQGGTPTCCGSRGTAARERPRLLDRRDLQALTDALDSASSRTRRPSSTVTLVGLAQRHPGAPTAPPAGADRASTRRAVESTGAGVHEPGLPRTGCAGAGPRARRPDRRAPCPGNEPHDAPPPGPTPRPPAASPSISSSTCRILGVLGGDRYILGVIRLAEPTPDILQFTRLTWQPGLLGYGPFVEGRDQSGFPGACGSCGLQTATGGRQGDGTRTLARSLRRIATRPLCLRRPYAGLSYLPAGRPDLSGRQVSCFRLPLES